MGSQSRIIRSDDPEARNRPSGEKATVQIESEWPSRVCKEGLQSSSTDRHLIQVRSGLKNRFRIILLAGLKTRAELYTWRGAISIIDLKLRINRLASYTVAYNSVCMS